MALSLEILTKAFLLLSACFQLLTRIICFAIDFLRTLLFLHLIMFWKIAVFPLAVLSLPIRALAALHRQRTMEMQVQRMKKALETSLWDRKELKERLDAAVQERKMMEVMLVELEAEHDEAILQIELLVRQVEELKDEIRRPQQISRAAGEGLGGDKDWMTRRRADEEYMRNNKIWSGRWTDSIMAKKRGDALSQSLFSAALSVAVGFVAWQAQEPCIPLVTAMVTVVAMSLTTVVRFFSTFQHRPPTCDAVALLCFNCFLLGMLAYPVLPALLHLLA